MSLSDLFYRDLPSIASLVALWEVAKAVYVRVVKALPIRSVLGELSSDKVPCLVFVKHLYTPAHDNKYNYKLPDYFAPKTTGMEAMAVNIPNVVAKADATAIGDLLNALGQSGRHDGIEIVDPVTHWDRWDASVVCVGGSFKAEEVWKKCSPLPVTLFEGAFRLPTGNKLEAVNQDFGLICKTKNPDNQRDVWLIIGLGVYGTEAAGYFLRTNLSRLGRLYGSSPFAVVVRTTPQAGGRQATLWWRGEIRSRLRRLVFWQTASFLSPHGPAGI